MPYSPPRWLESLADALVPPASAEHVLGDLAESSPSNRGLFAQPRLDPAAGDLVAGPAPGERSGGSSSTRC